MIRLVAISLLTVLSLSAGFSAAAQQKYKHILVTNDDGVEDLDRLLKLANAVKPSAQRVSIFVPDTDKSGSSNKTLLGKHIKTLSVMEVSRDTVNQISVYTTNGNPADCVLLGLTGFFGDNKPDLVLSGINGGSNSGAEWFGSGTIGAARMASYLGTKAVALSGCNDKVAEFSQVLHWVNKLILSPVMELIGKQQYLTVGLPEDVKSIKGVKLNERRISCEWPEHIQAQKVDIPSSYTLPTSTTWQMSYKADPRDLRIVLDDVLIQQGFIVVTPMSINENSSELLDAIKKTPATLPAFR